MTPDAPNLGPNAPEQAAPTNLPSQNPVAPTHPAGGIADVVTRAHKILIAQSGKLKQQAEALAAKDTTIAEQLAQLNDMAGKLNTATATIESLRAVAPTDDDTLAVADLAKILPKQPVAAPAAA